MGGKKGIQRKVSCFQFHEYAFFFALKSQAFLFLSDASFRSDLPDPLQIEQHSHLPFLSPRRCPMKGYVRRSLSQGCGVATSLPFGNRLSELLGEKLQDEGDRWNSAKGLSFASRYGDLKKLLSEIQSELEERLPINGIPFLEGLCRPAENALILFC
jgi:hypothetical protein